MRGARRRRTCWWCAIATASGCSPHVFGSLRAAGINAQQTENIVFDGAAAAMARIQLDQAPPAATLEAIRGGSEDVIDLKLVEIPA